MRTVLSIGIMSLAGRHGISVLNSTSLELVGRYCQNEYQDGADVDVENYFSPDNEGILHCKIDDLCKNVLSARSSPDMIRSFEESVGRLIRGYLDVKKDVYSKHIVKYLKDGGHWFEVVCHSKRKKDHKKMRTV